MNFTYIPDDFAINMDMYMNNDVIFSNSFSGKMESELIITLNLLHLQEIYC